MDKKIHNYIVAHPGHGQATVEATSEVEAIQEAAKRWDAKWTAIHWECTVSRGKRVEKSTCPICKATFAKQTGKRLCTACNQRAQFGQPVYINNPPQSGKRK